MATSQGRRKHCACLLRIRENCPFRRLRKGRCYDMQSASVQHWGQLDGSATSSHVGRAAAEVPPESRSQSDMCLPGPQIHLPQVEFGNVSVHPVSIECSPKPPAPHTVTVPGPVLLSLPPAHPHQHLIAQPCNSSMEVDSGIDPETGEALE